MFSFIWSEFQMTSANLRCTQWSILLQFQASSGFAWPACQKKGKSEPQCWRREVSRQFTQQFTKATGTDTPLVAYVVLNHNFLHYYY